MIGILKTKITNIDKDSAAIQSLNTLSNTTVNTCLFCDTVSKEFIGQIRTNVLPRTHTSFFKGIIITDDLVRGQDLITTTYAKKRFVYLYTLDWHKISPLRFANLAKVLLNDHIELIVQNEQDSKIVEQLFKKPKYIMNNWDSQVLIEIDKNE